MGFYYVTDTLELLILFKKFLHESNNKPNRTWVEKGSKFPIRSIKSRLEKNPEYNKGKYVAAERFMRILKNKIYKDITSISKNVVIN